MYRYLDYLLINISSYRKETCKKTRAKARLWNVVFLDKTSLFSDDSIIKIQIISGKVNALQCFKIDNFYEDEIFYPNVYCEGFTLKNCPKLW